ncbi:hypothetical protein GGR58DRAFT_497672 [Xylaria digitata]|nr:hypothetical protein GGR58DRAFT_497672 [Xylaria digitata]
MKSVVALAFTIFATFAVAAPLNINLGAYSPALVVGDGAIGFRGGEGEAAAEGAAAAQGRGIISDLIGNYLLLVSDDEIEITI